MIRRGKGEGRSSDMYSEASRHFEMHKAAVVGSNLPECAGCIKRIKKKKKKKEKQINI